MQNSNRFHLQYTAEHNTPLVYIFNNNNINNNNIYLPQLYYNKKYNVASVENTTLLYILFHNNKLSSQIDLAFPH